MDVLSLHISSSFADKVNYSQINFSECIIFKWDNSVEKGSIDANLLIETALSLSFHHISRTKNKCKVLSPSIDWLILLLKI